METNRWIVGTDLSELSRLALVRALSDSRKVRGAEIHAVLALDGKLHSGVGDKQAAWDTTLREVRSSFVPFIDSAQVDAGVGDETPFFIHVDVAPPVEAILTAADEVGATQIYVGTHGRRGVQRAVLGSVSEVIVRHAHCPVLVVRPLELVDKVKGSGAHPRVSPGEPLPPHVYRYSETEARPALRQRT